LRFRRLVAFYEAGRAVIAWDAGLHLPGFSIYPEQHARGRILAEQEFPSGDSGRDRDEQHVYLRLLAAGPIAVVMAGGKIPVDPEFGIELDSHRIAVFVRRAGLDIDAVFRETAVKLAYLWEPVESLANALVMRETVSGPLASRIIRESHPGELLE
jgi:hypothetical protein